MLLAQLREAYGRVVYSHKKHEKQADICFGRHRILQGCLVALTALSSGTFLASLLGLAGSPEVASLVTSFVAVVVSALSLSAKQFKFSEEATAHRDIAGQLWDVRESYLSLITDFMTTNLEDVEIRERRDQLQKATGAIYSGAPRTIPKAYAKARDGLKNNEELMFTSREIDLLLPEALRLNEEEAHS